MPKKEAIDALFMVRRMQEKYRDKDKKLYMCFVDLKKAFDRVPRNALMHMSTEEERTTRNLGESSDESV